MSKQFNIVKRAKVKKSVFDLSHERKLSMEFGKLVPVLVQEVVPGDKFKIDTQSMIRLAPLVSPVMHRMNAYIHYFYVPNRILWNDWEKFITGELDILMPRAQMNGKEITIGSLGDHLGLPVGRFDDVEFSEYINLLPFKAYFKIWNDYYRDQNLQEEIDLDDINDIEYNTLYRAWEKDYFTSALPWAQKGQPVKMDASIVYKTSTEWMDQVGAPPLATTPYMVSSGDPKFAWAKADGQGTTLRVENLDEINIDVNDLRQATRLQRWLERNARAGTRYVEHLLAHWGVRSSDARLQRPEYIGGGKSPIVISEVLNTNGRTDDDPNALPQGNMSGHGINVGRTNQAYKFCEEHGFIIGIMSVMPEPNYMEGLPKMFSRMSNLDVYYPEFAQLGEQEVLKKELYLADASADANNATFGYQSRYAEYKYAPSTVHGDFRGNLMHWHWARDFANQPSLNEDFITCKPVDNRIFAVTSQKENLYVQLYHRITAVRPMPFFNDPML